MSITREMILAKSPCAKARQWMNTYPGATMQELWDTCPRGDWLLWVCYRFNLLDKRTAAAIACAIVRETPVGSGHTIWDLLTDERSRQAVEVTEAWLAGTATLKEVQTAARAAYAAADAAAAYAAVDAATYAVADAANAAIRATYAANIANVAADADADADAADATAAARAAIADIVRRFVMLEQENES